MLFTKKYIEQKTGMKIPKNKGYFSLEFLNEIMAEIEKNQGIIYSQLKEELLKKGYCEEQIQNAVSLLRFTGDAPLGLKPCGFLGNPRRRRG